MTGWRFSDRGWFHNERLNLRAEANRRLIADELVERNVVFGSHRWFAGGGSPSLVAITTIEQWDDEVARGRPGDNIILLSLRKVAQMALVHAWDASTPWPEAVRPEDAAVIEAYDRMAKLGELLCVRRFTPTSGQVEAALDRIDLRDVSVPWQEQLAEAAASGGGEIWLFDGELDCAGPRASPTRAGTARVMDSPPRPLPGRWIRARSAGPCRVRRPLLTEGTAEPIVPSFGPPTIARMTDRPLKVLIAKPGLDGHDRGAKVLARGLRDEGFEVVYTGLRQTPEMIVTAALQEDVDVVGLSILSGAHMTLVPKVCRQMREKGLDDVLVTVGGIIPDDDVAPLKAEGVAAVFGPGTTIREVADFIRGNAKPRE